MSIPSWDLYRTFEAVLRTGSLSRAARTLGLTQPSIARHIDALEQAIGRDLFVRSQRGLTPTAAALELRPYAELLASTSAALLRTAEGSAGAVAGTVRISASEVVSAEHLPAMLARLRHRYPALTFELSASNTLDDLLQRQADVAVRMVQPVQQSLIGRKVAPIPVGLHAHTDYLARRGVPATLRDLADHDLIGFDTETPAIRAFAERFPDLNRAAFTLRVDSDITQLAAIRAGFGIGICQVPVAARDPQLIRVLADCLTIELDVWIVMHEDLSNSPRCRAVFDALVAEFS
ncbi:LysR family transcriptional regulator [Sphingomonas prati]|uniref:DNA-binding transcriptional LysR family regulator n=1 Tax=Sphingomonas prati TaxID=1843237 RepID=A0A7W9BUV2_9SPHN|nr:LysR family transcriptional regulator [Sphingomonas prati]MBB5730536.1 DNA-binding transcriptional LysR family regulator [Sphingomonas prati]GGE94805.1 LysR family transcriptional regulator [Sphingomonas prati]